MSDNARELLIYGVAAAKANSRDEARNYLEWVLRTDADFDQQAEAWYWLSTITDNPKEKRDALENVLAILPRHPEARRDIAILEGRLRLVDMHDPRRAVAPSVPSAQIDRNEVESFKCPRCGARLTARGVNGALHCGFCGYQPGSETSPGGLPGQDNEQDWVAAIYAVHGHRWELPTERVLGCASCGATVVLPLSNVSVTCPFCSVPYVAQTQAERELIEPTGVAPFAFDAQAAWKRMIDWLANQRFAPGDLAQQARPALPRPVFLPFWTFDMEGIIGWRGFEVSTSYGRQVRVPVTGSVPLFYDDILVPGTRSLPEELLSELEFNTKDLRPYKADLLASWPAEVYSISVADASLGAREMVRNAKQTQGLVSTSVAVAGQVQDWTIDRSELTVLSYKLALLPVWVGSYDYEGRRYVVLANGQTGQVEGEIPRNPVQNLLDKFFGD